MTPYRLLLGRTGLSQPEAADFHGVRLDSVKSWCSGRNRAPDGVTAEVRALYGRQKVAAREALAAIAQAPPEAEIKLGYADDDHEAQGLGWPCASAQWAVLGMVVAAAVDRQIVLVPRGSTLATAAAAHAHEKPFC